MGRTILRDRFCQANSVCFLSSHFLEVSSSYVVISFDFSISRSLFLLWCLIGRFRFSHRLVFFSVSRSSCCLFYLFWSFLLAECLLPFWLSLSRLFSFAWCNILLLYLFQMYVLQGDFFALVFRLCLFRSEFLSFLALLLWFLHSFLGFFRLLSRGFRFRFFLLFNGLTCGWIVFRILFHLMWLGFVGLNILCFLI